MPFLPELLALLQVLLIDLSMAGDNVLVVGLAAAGLPAERRHHAVMAGIAGATILRIVFALFAVQLLQIAGLLAAGGVLLLWVTWKMYEELRHAKKVRAAGEQPGLKPVEIKPKNLSSAIWQIVIADLSMSLDNVLGVAGVARDHVWVLVTGLSISVVLMGVASTYVARIAARHSWIAYIGLAVVFYTALNMVWDGAQPFLKP
jgi:YjbE family integral membrane protein